MLGSSPLRFCAGDLVIDGIYIGVLDHGVERFEYTILKQRGMNPIGKVVELVERPFKLGIAVLIAIVHAEHSDKYLFEHGGFAICRKSVLAQVAWFDMETRKLRAVSDDLELAAVYQLAVLRALDDVDEVVLRERANEGDAHAQKIGDILERMQLLLGFLGLGLHGHIGKQPDLIRQGPQIIGAFEPLLDDVQWHVARLLQMQDNLEALDIVHGVLSIPLWRAMWSYEPLVLEEADLGVG